MVEFDWVEAGGGDGGKSVKSCQKVEKSSKSPKKLKGLKYCKGHRFGETFTEAPIVCRRTRASVIALTVFQAPQEFS